MKITALVENQSHSGCAPRHGLSLYIETKAHKLLFDVGPDKTLFENSRRLGIDLTEVDTVIISHGHNDHGGALGQFLMNAKAKIYAQRTAFENHYSQRQDKKVNIGIDPALASHPQVILLDGDTRIDGELFLFLCGEEDKCHSTANDTLFMESGLDDFSHEQNLIVSGSPNVLIMGCGHRGIVNILEKAAPYHPGVCVGGYHLYSPSARRTVPCRLLDSIAKELSDRDIPYFTCHCTGKEAYDYLRKRVRNMNYLTCGETIEV